jgi:hypothetical protein
MFGFLIGWGVFWLLIWAVVLLTGLSTKEENWTAAGTVFGMISIIYLIAVIIGRLVM